MDIKIIFSALSVIIGTWAFIPYLRDVLKKETHPHSFTWLIWGITQGTAAAGLWVGEAGVGAIPLTVGTCLVTLIFILSLRHGEKDITRSDLIVLIVALVAICIWWLLDNPLIAILMVSAIDVVGYIPSIRKSYQKPWTENASSWGAWAIAGIFAILALESYNLLTLSYLIAISTANSAFLIFLLIRRRSLSKINNK